MYDYVVYDNKKQLVLHDDNGELFGSKEEATKAARKKINQYFGTGKWKQEAVKVGDKVHCPSGFCKVLKVDGNKVIVRGEEGDHEYDMAQLHKEAKPTGKDLWVNGDEEENARILGACTNLSDKDIDRYKKLKFQMLPINIQKSVNEMADEIVNG